MQMLSKSERSVSLDEVLKELIPQVVTPLPHWKAHQMPQILIFLCSKREYQNTELKMYFTISMMLIKIEFFILLINVNGIYENQIQSICVI